eukprot:3006338-Rhodomonas_salina.1
MPKLECFKLSDVKDAAANTSSSTTGGHELQPSSAALRPNFESQALASSLFWHKRQISMKVERENPPGVTKFGELTSVSKPWLEMTTSVSFSIRERPSLRGQLKTQPRPGDSESEASSNQPFTQAACCSEITGSENVKMTT